MDKIKKYDPEDIESLLLNKPFEELYPEERKFVLEHLDSEAEYSSMRSTLLAVLESNEGLDRIEPRESSRDELIALMAKEEPRGFVIWLNGILAFLWPPEVTWYRKPAVQLAVAGFILFFAIVPFTVQDNNNLIAEVEEVKTQDSNELEKNTDGNIIESEDVQPEADNSLEVVEDVTLHDEVETIEEGSNYSILNESLEQNNEVLFAERELGNEPDTDSFSLNDEVAVDEDFEEVADAIDFAKTEDVKVSAEKTTAAGDLSLDKIKEEESIAVIESADTASLDFFMADDALGNALESVAIMEVSATRGTDATTNQSTEDEAITGTLFGSKDISPPVSAPTKKYKDLIDLLYTAL